MGDDDDMAVGEVLGEGSIDSRSFIAESNDVRRVHGEADGEASGPALSKAISGEQPNGTRSNTCVGNEMVVAAGCGPSQGIGNEVVAVDESGSSQGMIQDCVPGSLRSGEYAEYYGHAVSFAGSGRELGLWAQYI
ncbi:hypothetical protein Dimus_029972 [Dionaea muscipula]